MRKLLIRHGLSEANNYKNIGTPAFGSPDAGLMEEGKVMARDAGRLLVNQYGVDILSTEVAVSEMLRTQETALEAGFPRHNMTPYASLNEVTSSIIKNLSQEQIINAIVNETPPAIAIQHVEELLANPPEEEIWFTHGFVIATICYVRGIKFDRFIPQFCEIRDIEIGESGNK